MEVGGALRVQLGGQVLLCDTFRTLPTKLRIQVTKHCPDSGLYNREVVKDPRGRISRESRAEYVVTHRAEWRHTHTCQYNLIPLDKRDLGVVKGNRKRHRYSMCVPRHFSSILHSNSVNNNMNVFYFTFSPWGSKLFKVTDRDSSKVKKIISNFSMQK